MHYKQSDKTNDGKRDISTVMRRYSSVLFNVFSATRLMRVSQTKKI